MMNYSEFTQRVLSLGFIYVETTEMGFQELLAVGFTADDILDIESDLQCGFELQDSIDAMERRATK